MGPNLERVFCAWEIRLLLMVLVLLLMVLVLLLVLLVAFEKTTRCLNAVKAAVGVLSLGRPLP